MIILTTFAGWLSEQNTRQDAVGEIARLWAQISPGRTHSLVGVTKAITEHAEQAGMTWVPDAMAATAEEFRVWKVNPEAASTASPQTRSQLDRIEAMLARLLDNLGIPLEDPPQLVGTEQTGVVVTLHEGGGIDYTGPDGRKIPHIGPNGLEMIDPHVLTASDQAAGVEAVLQPGGKPDWAKLYGLSSSVELPEGTELGEQAE